MRIALSASFLLAILILTPNYGLADKKQKRDLHRQETSKKEAPGIIRIKSKELYNSFKEKNIPLIIKYSMESCGWCHFIAPAYEKIANNPKYDGKANFIELWYDDGPEIAAIIRDAGITGFPSFEVVYQGQTKRKVGAGSKEDLEDFISKALETFEKAKKPQQKQKSKETKTTNKTGK